MYAWTYTVVLQKLQEYWLYSYIFTEKRTFVMLRIRISLTMGSGRDILLNQIQTYCLPIHGIVEDREDLEEEVRVGALEAVPHRLQDREHYMQAKIGKIACSFFT